MQVSKSKKIPQDISLIIENCAEKKKEKFEKLRIKKCPIISLMNAKMPLTGKCSKRCANMQLEQKSSSFNFFLIN